MAVAVPFIVGALTGAIAFAAKGVFWAIMGGLLGAGLVGLQMLLTPSAGQLNLDVPVTTPQDTGLGFEPRPTPTSSEQPVAVIYGRTMITPQLIDQQAYGSNLRRSYLTLGIGEGPLTVHNLYINGTSIERLSNYSEIPGDPDHTWWVSLPLGSSYNYWISNTGTISWGASGNETASCSEGECKYKVIYSYDPPQWDYWTPGKPGSDAPMIEGPVTVLYGNPGDIKVVWQLHQTKTELCCWCRVGLADANNPADIIWGKDTTKLSVVSERSPSRLDTSSMPTDGWIYVYTHPRIDVGSGQHMEVAYEIGLAYQFAAVTGEKQYKPIVQYCLSAAPENAHKVRVIFDRVEINDPGKQYTVQYWGTCVVLLHLCLSQTQSGTPNITALVSGFGVLPGDAYGSPPLCAYHFLTGRLSPDGEQTYLTNRLDPDLIDWDSVQETIAFCKALKGGEGYWFNRAYGATTDLNRVLSEITTAGRFMVVRSGNKFVFLPDRASEPVYAVSEAEEIAPGSLVYGRGSIQAPEQLEAQYVDQGLIYTVQRINVEASDALGIGGRETLDLTGVTDQQQAYELARYVLLCRRLNQHWVNFETGYPTAAKLRVGDIILIDSAVDLVSSRRWRIISMSQRADRYQVNCIEANPAVYTSILGTEQEQGYVSYSPWIQSYDDISIWELGSPDTGPSRVYNLVITNIRYLGGTDTEITGSYTINPERADYVQISYRTGDLDNWTVVIPSNPRERGGFTFVVALRWGALVVRARAYYGGRPGLPSDAAIYVSGTGDDYPGFGRGQYGWQPYGY